VSGGAALVDRARASCGRSDEHIYRRAAALLKDAGVRGVVADVGCGEGRLRAALEDVASAYVGIDAVRFPALPSGVAFHAADLDREPLPLAEESVDAAVALETVEHLENPRRLLRELTRVTRRGGTLLVSTPNQSSASNVLSLLVRARFVAFQDADYPAHLTALLPIDLLRIARECRLRDPRVVYSGRGRIPWTSTHYPAWLSRLWPRLFSDHVFLIARREH
jgi:2-polyprenyl-3-methyl-5-hydroxy-6-metoxy-1,4-benzoquinol methylase